MSTLSSADPRIEFERRYAHQALESAIARGEPDILVRGPRGTGKTMMIADICYRLGLQFPGMTQIWTRKDRTDMDDSVLAAFEDEVLGIGHPLRGGPNRVSRTGYDLGNGSTIRLRGIKGADSGKSISADLIWVCEASELTEREYDEIGVTKRQRVGVTTFPYQCKISDFNPMPPSHWTNRRCPEFSRHLYPRVPPGDGSDLPQVFTPEMYCEAQEFNFATLDRKKYSSKLIVCFHADNPGYWNIEPWGWTSAGLKYCQDTLAPLGLNMRARYLEGRPVAVEGVVFEEFNREFHLCTPFAWPAEWPAWIAYDPGYAHPCAVVFWGVAPDGRFYIIDEIHGRGWDIDQLGLAIKAKAAQYRVAAWLDDPRGANQKTQIAHGKTVRDYMRENFQIHFRPWQAAEGKGKQSQVEAVRALLLKPDDKRLQIFETCVGVISEFESWKNKTDAKGELLAGDDAYEDCNNDAMDAIMGIVADNPKFVPTKAPVVFDPDQLELMRKFLKPGRSGSVVEASA